MFLISSFSIDLVLHCLLDIEYLSPERQDGLEAAVAALFGCSACRVSLDKEYLGDSGITVGTVSQLARQS